MDRWINAQRIGVAAFCLRQFSRPAEVEAIEKALKGAVNAYLDAQFVGPWAGRDKLEVGLESHLRQIELPRQLQTLPLSTLHLLRRVSVLDDTVGDICDIPLLRAAVEKALQLLAWDNEDSVAPKCRVLAHHILYGAANAKRVASLSYQLFTIQRKGRIGTSAMDRLADLLSSIRSSDCSTKDRVFVTTEIAKLLASSKPIACAQIENALLHRIFCWPLLVLPNPQFDVAVSVPVAVDSRFDAKDTTWQPGGRYIGEDAYVVGASHIDLDTTNAEGRTFASYLAEAVRVGRELWRKTHGHTSDWREVIKTVPVVYDFQFASQAIDGILGHLGLHDGSAGAYFAQVVLARLLGRDPCLSSAITGIIGQKVTYPTYRKTNVDYYMEMPDAKSLPRKLQFVFESQLFERVVIPTNRQSMDAMGLAHQTVEVLEAAKLSTVADIVQVRGWRKTHYVRCPDVAWAVREGLFSPENPDFQRVKSALANNENPIIRLPDISPRAVASYLGYFNRVELQNLEHKPPSLSWAFIRAAADYEQDESFWHVLWRITGAPDEDFELFCCSPTTEAAGPVLKRVLNTFEPNRKAKCHRAPDIVVIIGVERLEEKLKRLRMPAQRPLAVPAVLEWLSRPGELMACPYSRPNSAFRQFRAWIGTTRIILLSDEPLRISSLDLKLNEEEVRILKHLGTFAWSITQSTAALLRGLKVHGEPIDSIKVREILEDFKGRKLLRYSKFGEYFIPRRVRQTVEALLKGDSYQEQACRHFVVGSALAPYLTVAVPGQAYDTAFIPERVHEAQHHLREAGRLYSLCRDDAGKKKAREAQRQIMRFGRLAGWGTAPDLIKSKDALACKDAYLFIEEFMESWRNHPLRMPNHPTHLVYAAKALRYFHFSDNELQSVSERFWGGVEDKSTAILNLFERALEACRAFPGEETYARLCVLSEYSDYLEAQGTKLRQQLRSIDEQIMKLRPSWPECPGAIRGGWFEAQADTCQDHREAAGTYAEGAQCALGWHQLKVKGAGALCIARLRHQLLADLRDLPQHDEEQTALKVLAWVNVAKRRDYQLPIDRDWESFKRRKRMFLVVGRRA